MNRMTSSVVSKVNDISTKMNLMFNRELVNGGSVRNVATVVKIVIPKFHPLLAVRKVKGI